MCKDVKAAPVVHPIMMRLQLLLALVATAYGFNTSPSALISFSRGLSPGRSAAIPQLRMRTGDGDCQGLSRRELFKAASIVVSCPPVSLEVVETVLAMIVGWGSS